ncbi:MAG TPA: PepSY-associated TM helix domain-containing protein [Pseudonocardia sp.]|jgi:uncharacterized iron-regulated membrane protein|nr:PepSY-associated TM helix domain-containing protein [Pseudonocardia sp.]
MSEITVSTPADLDDQYQGSDTDTDRDTSLETAPPPAGSARAWWWRELRPLLLRVHFYAGLFVGPFVLVAALTGLLYTTTPQLEQIVHHDQLHVPVPPGATALPLSRQVSAAVAALPAGRVTAIRPAGTPDGTTRVVFDAPGVPEDYSRTVFLDPYTAQVRGILTTYGEWLPLRAWFDELHRTLHLGAVGRVYTELAASWLWVLTLSGLAIWVARRRRTRALRRTLAPRLRGAGRARVRSWHGSVGLWAAVGLLFLSATGLTWSQFAGTNVDTLRSALHWSSPSVHTALPAGAGLPAGPGPAATSTGLSPAELATTAERVLAAARAHGLGDPVQVTPASRPGRAWVVAQTQRSWPEKQDSVAVDPATGTVVDQLRFADWPLAAKLARWGIDAHMGLLFGLASQIALAALALGLISMIVWGYRMWWLRRPTRTGAGVSPARGPGGAPPLGPPAGAQRPGFGAVALVGAVAIGVGVFLPVFGASLLVFLLVDALRPGRARVAAG